MDIWQIIEVLAKRKWLILLSVLVAMGATYMATRLTGARWVAPVTLVTPDTADATAAQTDGEDQAPSSSGAKQVAVYLAMIKSPSVLEPVLNAMGSQAPARNVVLDNIDFEESGSHLYTLSVTAKNPDIAQQLANGIANRFVELARTIRAEQANTAVEFLQGELQSTNNKLSATRARLVAYTNAHNIVGNMSNDVDAAYGDLQSANKKRNDVVAKVAEDQAQLSAAQSQLAAVPAVTPMDIAPNSSLMNEQIVEREKLQEHLDDLLRTRTEQHPDVVQARAELNQVNQRISDELSKVSHSAAQNPAVASLTTEIGALKLDIAGGRAQISALDAQVASASQLIQRYKGSDTGLGDLTQQVTQLQNDQSGLEDRLKRARVALDDVARASTITILTPVNDFNPPINTTRGRNVKFMLIAAICALLAMCGLIIAVNGMDRRLKNIREAEIAIPARLLASIPQSLPSLSASAMARITELQPQSIHSEAYRFLGLHLLNAPSPSIRSLMVLAAKAEQGSTTTICNLGITLSQAGKRVIIVDANIRTPELHQVFEVDNDYGFTNLLQSPDEASLLHAMRPTIEPNLHFITSGPSPANAWRLFRSQNLQQLSWLLHERADFVLYDTPSSLMFTDAMNLAPIVDAAILCVRAHQPLTGTEERLIEMLEDANVSVLGSVLSDVPAEMVDGYRNYQQHYRPVQAANDLRFEAPSARPMLPGSGVPLNENVTVKLNANEILAKYPAHKSKNDNGHSSHDASTQLIATGILAKYQANKAMNGNGHSGEDVSTKSNAIGILARYQANKAKNGNGRSGEN
jgi:succinoglycan biosynthesis transport protein ExoP